STGAGTLLVDPMLDAAGARPPVPDTPSPRPNPLVDLPEPAEAVVAGSDAVLVTHLHQDHLDATAIRLLPKERPLFCAPGDAGALRDHGFVDLRPVEDTLDWDGVPIARTGGVHGPLGPSPGFVIGSLYLAGDTIWCDEARAAIDAHRPGVIVVNAGGARFLEGGPLVMTADDVVAVARYASDARVIAVHLEAINHCLQTRAELRARLDEEGLTGRVLVPEDGTDVPLL
ncbi:MAG TPA: MBL fold metallo-hydrolase, partial [Solirubrobacteraceae bacterium]|nr:MBL fold metallo-hydrolase [Solirubrobacteraceae bacterium]